MRKTDTTALPKRLQNELAGASNLLVALEHEFVTIGIDEELDQRTKRALSAGRQLLAAVRTRVFGPEQPDTRYRYKLRGRGRTKRIEILLRG